MGEERVKSGPETRARIASHWILHARVSHFFCRQKHMFRLGIPEEHRVTMWRFLVRLRTHSIRKVCMRVVVLR